MFEVFSFWLFKMIVVLWYMIIIILIIDYNVYVVLWENCNLDSMKYF